MEEAGDLQAGDIITEIDETAISNSEEFADFAESEQSDAAGFELTITRDGDEQELVVEDLTELEVATSRHDPYDIEIDTAALNIGGPSAGMMFALAIIDRVSTKDLTGGVNIAGTGEIDPEGNVGAIGGVQQKTVGAHAAGADYFFAPTANCADAAASAPDGLDIVGVETLDDAMSALAAIAANEPVPSC